MELTRDVAQRFNNLYGQTFKIPEPFIPKVGARIMDLLDPVSKMSKSDENANGCVYILDDKDTILRKFRRAVTDSDCVVCCGEGKEGIVNLMSIYGAVTGKTMEEIEAEFKGKGYGDFKSAVGEAVADHLAPIRSEYARLSADKAYLTDCMKNGAEQAGRISRRTLAKVYRKVGFLELK